MAAHAGGKADTTGDCSCTSCDEEVHAEQGQEIPECPNGPHELRDAPQRTRQRELMRTQAARP